jgi:hypothetical protein
MDRPANGIYGLFGRPYLLPAKSGRQPPDWPVEPHINEVRIASRRACMPPRWSCGQRAGWYSSEAPVRRPDQIMPKGACAQRKY